jgi:tetratricopeptide (TPR) repeat protein
MGRWRASVIACLVLLVLVPLASQIRARRPNQDQRALPAPQQLFARVAPSVFIVEALGASGQPIASGSGIALSPTEVVTNRHVIEDGITLRIRQGAKTWPAIITHLDSDHDLCELEADGLRAKPAEIRNSSTIKVGERVYAIGAPEGLELTFSEGLISGIREYRDGRVIQTSAAISHGSSGGGLFDVNGRLVGITTFTLMEGQNLNFALPTEWIAGLRAGHRFSGDARPDKDSPAYHELLLLELAKQARDNGDYKRAIQAEVEATKLVPDEPVAWHNLGNDYSSLNDHEHALAALLKAAELAPNNSTVWDDLGGTYEDLGDYEKAINAHKNAIRLKADDPQHWNDLGTAYHLAQRNADAVAAYLEALRLDPKIAMIWANLGRAYEDLHDYAKARAALEEAIRLDPQLTDAWYVLGELYAASSERDRVLKVYQQLKALDSQKAERFFREIVAP